MITEVLARQKLEGKILVSKENLVWIIKAVDDKKVQRLAAKDLLSDIWGTTLSAEEQARKKDILADLSTDFVLEVIEKVVKEKSGVVEQFKREKDQKY